MASTLRSFAQSSGQLAGKKSGDFSGKLLGKMAEGIEALEAIAALAENQFNNFMTLAQAAVKTYAKKLETKMTIPFANPDEGFNPTLNKQKAAIRQVPALGLGGGSSPKTTRKSKDESKDE